MESGRQESNDRNVRGQGAVGPVLDFDVIESLRELGGEDEPELVLELVDLFLGDAQERLEGMQRALEQGRLDEVARAAHTIKSAAANVGACMLSELCAGVERMIREGRSEGLAARAQACQTAFDATAAALRGVDV